MALPTSYPASGLRTPTGIELGIHPSTEGRFAIELRRSTQSSTASTSWFTQQLSPSSGAFKVVTPLPLSTRTYYFQARHVGVGYSVGAYSPVVSAKPVKLSIGGNVPIVRGKNAAVEVPLGDVWLTSAKTVKVGTQATTATITRTIRFPAHQFQPESTATRYTYGTNGIAIPNAAAGTTQSFWTVFPFPPGVKLTSCTLEGERRQTTDKSFVRLVAYRQFHGAATTWFTINLGLTTGALGFTDTASSVLSQTIGSSGVLARLILFREAGAGTTLINNARAHAVTWTYTRGEYDDAY